MQGIGFYEEDTFTLKIDTDIIKENITRILLTAPGERVNNYSFGSYLKTYLFNLPSIMREEVNSEIMRAISRWEPRVNVVALRTSNPDPHIFSISLKCEIKETLEEFDYETLLRL